MVHGADVRATTPAGDTPLLLAATVAEARGFSSVCVRMLLQRGADAQHRNVRGSTALHAAAARCSPDTVRLLLGAGASPQAADRDGNGPLHLAAGATEAGGGNEHRGLQTIRLLLLAGADPAQRNQIGATPMAVASSPAAAAMLERALDGLLPAPFSHSSLRDMRGKLPSWAKAWGDSGAMSRASSQGPGEGTHHSAWSSAGASTASGEDALGAGGGGGVCGPETPRSSLELAALRPSASYHHDDHSSGAEAVALAISSSGGGGAAAAQQQQPAG